MHEAFKFNAAMSAATVVVKGGSIMVQSHPAPVRESIGERGWGNNGKIKYKNMGEGGEERKEKVRWADVSRGGRRVCRGAGSKLAEDACFVLER